MLLLLYLPDVVKQVCVTAKIFERGLQCLRLIQNVA
jgi:hypothetical protein